MSTTYKMRQDMALELKSIFPELAQCADLESRVDAVIELVGQQPVDEIFSEAQLARWATDNQWRPVD